MDVGSMQILQKTVGGLLDSPEKEPLFMGSSSS